MTVKSGERRSIADVAKQVLTDMRTRNVPVTPQNYHVWFEYLTGENAELSAAVQAVITENLTFTPQISEELYNRFIGIEHQKLILQKLQRQTREMLRSVLAEVGEVSQGAGSYGAKLHSYAESLNNVQDLNGIENLIKNIVTDTQVMANASEDLQTRLNETMRRVRVLESRLEAAESDALRDALTGLKNRRGGQSAMAGALAEWEDSAETFSVLMCDIDKFKEFNDTYGHLIGDAVLRLTANSLVDSIRGHDTACRWGGEEFLIVLKGTSLANARHVADGLRRRISIRKLKLSETDVPLPPITMSFGVSEIREGDTYETLVQRADKALYRAKETGRNRVCTETEIQSDRPAASA